MFMPRGIPHVFRNLSDEPGEHVLTLIPGGLEKLFREVSAAQIQLPRDKAKYDADVKGFVDIAFAEVPRIPLYQPYVNVAMQKNVSGYQYWFHRRLDYRALVKG